MSSNRARKKGSSSNTRRADENEEVDNGDKSYLSSRPGGVWWTDENIVDLLGESITSNYTDFCPNWTNTPQAIRDHMFNWLKDRVRFDDENELRKGYESLVKKMLANYVYRAGKSKKKPGWMPVPCFEKLKKRREEDAKFKKVSKKATENRLKGGSDGKAPPTHVLGRKSASRALDAVGNPKEATPFRLLELSKKNKEGKWISKKAEEIEAEFKRKKSRVESGEIDMDEYQLYLESVGGFDKKGRVYGVRGTTTEFFTPTRHRSSQHEVPAYNPGTLSQTVKENTQLRSQVSKLEAQQMLMLKKMQEELGWTFTDETCNPGPGPSQ